MLMAAARRHERHRRRDEDGFVLDGPGHGNHKPTDVGVLHSQVAATRLWFVDLYDDGRLLSHARQGL